MELSDGNYERMELAKVFSMHGRWIQGKGCTCELRECFVVGAGVAGAGLQEFMPISDAPQIFIGYRNGVTQGIKQNCVCCLRPHTRQRQ